MKVRYVVPIDDKSNLSISEHFGHAQYFAILVKENDNVKLEEIIEIPRDRGIRPGEYAAELSVDAVIIRGNIGYRALELFRSKNIKVYKTDCEDVECVIEELKKGNLTEFTGEPCPGHGH